MCAECALKGKSITVCRQTLHHTGSNVFKQTSFKGTSLPDCCKELTGLQVESYAAGEKQGYPREDYATGYMIPYEEKAWENWFRRFILQMGCQYTIRRGMQTNEQSREVGVIKLQGKLRPFKSVWTHSYHCLRGGKANFKSLTLNKKNRCAIGTRRTGCNAQLLIRLLKTLDGTEVLEIKVPTLDAHFPAHDPCSISDQMCMKPVPELEKKVCELVQESLLSQRALKMTLKTWVEKELIPKHLETGVIQEPPSQYNRAYYPNPDDIRVMVKRVIAQERNSHFDQGAVLQLLQEEKEKQQLKFFFRQYTKDGDRCGEH